MHSWATMDRVKSLPETDAPRTLAELNWWLYFHGAGYDGRLVKASGQWLIATPAGTLVATGIRALSSLSLAGWARLLEG